MRIALRVEALEARDVPAPLGLFWGPVKAGGGTVVSGGAPITPLFSNWTAIGPAIAMVPATAGPLSNVSVVNFGTTVYSGDLNVANTIARIRANGNPISSNDGDIYNNNNGALPSGTWYEFVVDPDNGTNMNFSTVADPGPMRLTLSTTGKLYYTGDHYSSFTPVYLPGGVPTIGSFTTNPAAIVTGGSVTLTAANVVPASGIIANVKFYRESNGTAGLQTAGDTLLGTGTSAGSTWTLPTSTTGLPLGSQSYYAVATDNFAATATAATALTITAAAPPGTLLAWDVNGQSAFGTQGLLAGSVATGVTNTLGLTRGTGVTTTPTATTNAWGGNGWSTTTAAGVTADDTVTFGFTVAAGRSVSLSSLDLTYRRSSSGPADGLWQYKLNNAAWTTISDTTGLFSSTNSGGADMSPLNLTPITSLQNITAGTAVTFRVVPAGSSASGGTWYVYDGTGNDLTLNGTSVPAVNSLTINGGAPQRSLLTTITVNLGAAVDASTLTGLGAVTLSRTAGGPATLVQTGATGANGRILVSPSTGMVTSFTLTFDNANGAVTTAGVEAGSLADGRWRLAIPALNFQSPLNDVNLHRLFGDADGNASIGISDLTAFGNAFNTTAAAFDFNRDGTVDITDLTAFGNRFGMVV